MESIMLTTEETAEYLKLTPQQVTRLAREKKIPAIKLGKYWYVHKDKLDKLIHQKTAFIV